MNKPTKDVLLQYVYDFGLEETARLLKITPNEIDKILNPINETIYIHKQNYKPVTINSTVAEVIANNYDRLRTKFVGNTTNLALSQTDEDIFHNTLLKVMEEPDVIEDKILEHIEYRINMVRFQTKMDNKLLKKSLPMPYLPKPNKQPQKRSINKEERKKIYDTIRWRKLRSAHLQQYPLCQLCQQEGKVVPAIDVHHITSFMSTNDHLKRLALAYNPNNLMSLCKECHQKVHNHE